MSVHRRTNTYAPALLGATGSKPINLGVGSETTGVRIDGDEASYRVFAATGQSDGGANVNVIVDRNGRFGGMMTIDVRSQLFIDRVDGGELNRIGRLTCMMMFGL